MIERLYRPIPVTFPTASYGYASSPCAEARFRISLAKMAAQELEHLFYEGAYERILSSTANTDESAKSPFVVGALAFTGRLDEAEITGRILSSDKTRPLLDLVAARFFLCAGACHAGMLDRAMRWARQNMAALRSPDPRSRFFAFQGFSLVRYFEGRMARSRRLSLRALSAAIEAGFPYGRLLALDLRGHALVQTGQILSGLRLLEQAERLALDLGFVANAQTIQVSQQIYRARFRVHSVKEASSKLEELARSPIVSFFARRNAFLELAWQAAFAGRIEDAEVSIGEAARIALPDQDRRGRVRGLLARAVCVMFSQGRIAALPYLENARRLANPDPSLRVEVLFTEAAILGEPREGLPDELEALVSVTGIERASIARRLVGPTSSTAPVPSEDRFAELLLHLPALEPEVRAVHLVNEQLLGLVPWSFGLTPGTRIYLTGTSVLTEDHGNVVAHQRPSGPSLRVLRELAEGPKTNGELLACVWNLHNYAPARHDPTLHTAVARLRAALAPHGDWVLTTERGYQLAPDVELVTVGQALEVHAPEGADSSESLAVEASNRESHILEIVGRRRIASSAELAQDLRISDATALRSLRSLVDAGKLQRTGRGKSTRYSLFPEAIHAEGEGS